MRFHSKYELREIFPQVHHVGKQLSILINRMIVIIREESFSVGVRYESRNVRRKRV